MEKKNLKKNPLTNTTNLIFKKKGIFEW